MNSKVHERLTRQLKAYMNKHPEKDLQNVFKWLLCQDEIKDDGEKTRRIWRKRKGK